MIEQKTREFWDQKYKEKRSYYQLKGELEAVLREVPTGSSILDVGCGRGELIEQFWKSGKNYRAHGIDLSQIAIKDSRDEIKPFLKTCDLETDRIGFYDTIISKFAVKFFSKKALLKIKNSCKQF
ncbi:MAG: class I SAM-dependent methyltransferase, partial [Candidatus Gracilibacteria bacterium]|nr:class I SAM-dependent methyltransferase [Candidatus Gracilibacteria bacterium]